MKRNEITYLVTFLLKCSPRFLAHFFTLVPLVAYFSFKVKNIASEKIFVHFVLDIYLTYTLVREFQSKLKSLLRSV